MTRFPTLSFLLLTFAISWSMVFFAAATSVIGTGEQIGMIAMVLIGQFGPAIAAFIMVKKLHGWRGIRAYLKSGFSPRQPLPLIAFAVFFFPALFTLAFGIAIARGAPMPDFSQEMLLQIGGTFLVGMVVGFLFGGISEEFGWRAFLQPRLQRGVGFLIAGLLIAFIWAVWHLEPTIVSTLMTEGWAPFWEAEKLQVWLYFRETVATTFVMMWLFNRGKGSIFLAILIHSSSNASVMALSLLWAEKPEVWSETVTALFWVTAVLAAIAVARGPKEREDAAEKLAPATETAT